VEHKQTAAEEEKLGVQAARAAAGAAAALNSLAHPPALLGVGGLHAVCSTKSKGVLEDVQKKKDSFQNPKPPV
jgi:hypothetical protein